MITLIDFELVQTLMRVCLVINAVTGQLSFSFDRRMRFDRTLLRPLVNQLPSSFEKK